MAKLIQLEGRNLVMESLITKKRRYKEIIIDKGAKVDDKIITIKKLARKQGVRLVFTDRKKLDRMSQTKAHQGVIAIAYQMNLVKLVDIVNQNIADNKPSFFVLVDEISFEQNLGAIARTAYSAGADAIIVPNKGVKEESSVVAHVSAGASEHIPIITEGVYSATKKLRDFGIKIVGVEKGKGKNYFDLDLRGSVALLFGGEDKGLNDRLAEECDELATIPMLNDFSSLNVSVAAGVLMYEKVRQDMQK